MLYSVTASSVVQYFIEFPIASLIESMVSVDICYALCNIVSKVTKLLYRHRNHHICPDAVRASIISLLKDGKLVNADKHGINIYTEVLTPDIKTERQFVRKYLKVCEEKGWIPKYHRFLDKSKRGKFIYTKGYYKLLLDFKLFDEKGTILPQKAVVPIFDNEVNKRILEEYVEGEKAKAPNDEVYAKVVDAMVEQGRLTEEQVVEAMQKASAKEGVRFSLAVIRGLSDALNKYKDDGDIATFVEKVREVNDKVALGHPMIEIVLALYEEDGDAEWFAEKIAEIVGDYDGGYAPYTAGGVKYSIITDQIEHLFNEAVAGKLDGKPISIGTLTSEGKKYLEQISGLKLRDKVDFVLNPSDLRHIYNEHYGDNEKDKGNNIPLNIHDIRRIIDVISFPERIVYGVDKKGLKCFFFLMGSAEGTYNLLEIYSDGKGSMNSKTYYKTKKGVSQRVISLIDSLHSTPETDGATLSDTKIPQIFELPKIEARNSLIIPEMDAAYLSAVERGDMATAQKMVMEAAKLAMPNTKVVDENGNPKVVYHQTNHSVYINRETGQNWDELDWRERMEWDERDDWDEYWEEREFNTFSRVNARTTNEFDGFFFAPEYDEYHEYGNRTIEAFLNIENPASNGDYYIDSSKNNAGREERIRLQNEGYDGVIREYDGVVDEYIAFSPNQIKSAEPVTYDDNGNVIPLSERFNPEKEDIRYSINDFDSKVGYITYEANALGVEQTIIVAETLNEYLEALKDLGVKDIERCKKSAGIYDEDADVIVMRSDIIQYEQQAFETLIHEYAHAHTNNLRGEIENVLQRLDEGLIFAYRDEKLHEIYRKISANGILGA